MATLTQISPTQELSQPAGRQVATRSVFDFLLLGFMLVNLAMALEAAQWSPGLDKLFIITSIAVVAGALIAISDFSPLFSLVYTVITGAAAILYGLAGLATGVVTGREAVYQIVDRTIAWVEAIVASQASADTLVFVLLLAILLWLLSFNAAWAYFRDGRKWQTILPTGLAMLINLYYAPRDLKAYFILYLIAAMLLLVRATLAQRQTQWRRAHIHFPVDIGFDVMRDSIIFILFVVTVSWVLPTALAGDNQNMVNPLEDPWQQVKTEWNKLFSTLNYGEGSGVSPTVVFTASHPLGGARNISNTPVMDVQTTLNRYYQASLMDSYSSQSWELRNTVNINLVTDYHVPSPSYAARRQITQRVTMRQTTNVLMGAPMITGVDIPADARVIPQGLTPEEALAAETIGASEQALVISHALIQPGESYTITSSISFATESQLRSDSTQYAPDIIARYLQLPDTVPQRVYDLAEKIATGYNNPYDIAKAVETYVRSYPYNDQIPGPSPGQDAADYFLFEEKQGYCDYYATSMAVMLRHLGIPARLAQGYATGEYDPFTNSYRLTEKDAHAWVEVFFPTYGWIQFEPTSSEPVIERQAGAVEPPEPGGRASAVERDQPKEEERNIPEPKDLQPQGKSPDSLLRLSRASVGRFLLALGLVGLLIIGLMLRRVMRAPQSKRKLRTHKAPQAFIDGLWTRLLWWGRRLDVPVPPSLTPREQATAFAQALPQVSDDVSILAQLYARGKYSQHPLQEDELSEAQFAWLKLRSQFIRAWVDKRLQVFHRFRFWLR